MRNNDETLWVFKSKGEVPVLLNWKTPHFSDSCNFFPWQYHLTVACVTFCNMFFNKISNECKLRASVCFTWCAYPSSNSTWNPPSPHSFRWLKLSWVGVATFATSWNRTWQSDKSSVQRGTKFPKLPLSPFICTTVQNTMNTLRKRNVCHNPHLYNSSHLTPLLPWMW